MQPPAALPVITPAKETATPGPDDRDDAPLIAAAQRDPAAFAGLYRRYVTPIYRYLYSRVGNAQDAEDLTSQVFMEALRGLARYQHRGAFAAWLFTIARRRASNHYRRQPVVFEWDEGGMPSDEADPLSQVIHRSDLEHLRRTVIALNEHDQEAAALALCRRANLRADRRHLGQRRGRGEDGPDTAAGSAATHAGR